MDFHFPWNGKENVIYGVRWTREESRAIEYVVSETCAFGRIWNPRRDAIHGYWFNNNPAQVERIRKKVASAPLRKAAVLRKPPLKGISDIGSAYLPQLLIDDATYISLVDAAIKECDSMY